MSLSIVITCYNEVPVIFESYEKVVSIMDLSIIEYEIIIVDDGSSQKNCKLLSSYFEKKKNTTLILSDENQGRGFSVSKGIKNSSKEYVIFIDTDLEIPEYTIVPLYHNIIHNDSDIIIGKRIYKIMWDAHFWIRYVLSKSYFLFSNIVLQMGFLDTETGIKIFKKKKILPIIDKIKNKRWFWDTEIIAESLRHDLIVHQIPVFVFRRTDKKSSVKIFKDSFKYLVAIYNYIKRKNI